MRGKIKILINNLRESGKNMNFNPFKKNIEKTPTSSTEVIEDTLPKKEEYNPKVGDANRYENALMLNKELAKKINEEAQAKVQNALKVLDLLEKNPEMANYHSEISGSRWNIHYLRDALKELEALYGTIQLEHLNERAGVKIPGNVVDFEKRFHHFEYNKYDNQ